MAIFVNVPIRILFFFKFIYFLFLLTIGLCRLSIPTTILNRSQVAASVAKNKRALYILVWAPGANILQHEAHSYHSGCVDDQCLSPYQTRAK